MSFPPLLFIPIDSGGWWVVVGTENFFFFPKCCEEKKKSIATLSDLPLISFSLNPKGRGGMWYETLPVASTSQYYHGNSSFFSLPLSLLFTPMAKCDFYIVNLFIFFSLYISSARLARSTWNMLIRFFFVLVKKNNLHFRQRSNPKKKTDEGVKMRHKLDATFFDCQ